MIDFSNREEVERWLLGQPRKVAIALSARAALRTVPALGFELGLWGSRAGRAGQNLILPVFRAVDVAWVAARFPNNGMQLRGIAYSAAYGAAYSSNAAVSRAAAAAARAAAADADRPVAAAAANAIAASGASDAEAASAVSHDTDFIAHGVTSEDLAGYRLWPDSIPLWANRAWERVVQAVQLENDDWEVWTTWYLARLEGRSANESLELSRTTIPDGIWKQNPKSINGHIKRLLAASETHPWSIQISSVPQNRLGSRWVEHEDTLAIDPSGDDTDTKAAEDPRVQQLHEAVKRKAESLAEMCHGIEETLGWDGLEEALQRFLMAVNGDTKEIPGRIASLYDSAIELGSFLEFDNDLRLHPKGNVGRLTPDIRRAFADLIRTSAPFVRRFPTARELDDDAGAFLARPDLLQPSKTILDGARSEELISAEDRALLRDLLLAMERAGFSADKAGVRGIQGTRNLILAAGALVGTFYMGAVSADFSTKSNLVQKAASFLANHEKEVVIFMNDSADDLRLAYKEMVVAIKDNPPNRKPLPGEQPNATTPNRSRDDSTRTVEK